MAEPVQPREGEIAFAVSVATLYDLTIGRVGWPVRLTRHSSGSDFTLTLANRTPGGPVLNVLDWTLTKSVFQVNEGGMSAAQVSGYLDLLDQHGPPPAPAIDSELLRMYHRNGQLYFKVSGNPVEQQIPIGEPPGPSAHYAFWFGGG